jgi:hypothetical protein
VNTLAMLLAGLLPALTAQDSVSARDPLDPLRFMVGDWRARGRGPKGPFQLEIQVSRRGRWLFLTSDMKDPQSGHPGFVASAVWGADSEGKYWCYVFERRAYVFHGRAEGRELLFEWRQDQDWRRFRIGPAPQGKVALSYQVHERGQPRDASYELLWEPPPAR